MDLFKIVKAQGADDVASPTIPFTPPSGSVTITPTNPVVSSPTISLSTNALSVRQGETATIQIIIDTKAKEIKGFTLKIKYNPQVFKVIDADTKATGTQVGYNNTFFTANVNSVDEKLGFIEIKAASTSGTSPVTARVIAQFQVQGLTNGAGTFELQKNNSSLIDGNNVDILGAVNSVVVNVGTASATITGTPNPSGGSGTPVHPSITGGPNTPNTALADDLGNLASIFMGSFLIVTGYYLFRKKRHHDLH